MLDQMHCTRWRKVKMISLTWILHEGFQLNTAASFLCWHWPCYIGSRDNKTCCHPPGWSHRTPWWRTVCWPLPCSSSPSEMWQWLVSGEWQVGMIMLLWVTVTVSPSNYQITTALMDRLTLEWHNHGDNLPGNISPRNCILWCELWSRISNSCDTRSTWREHLQAVSCLWKRRREDILRSWSWSSWEVMLWPAPCCHSASLQHSNSSILCNGVNNVKARLGWVLFYVGLMLLLSVSCGCSECWWGLGCNIGRMMMMGWKLSRGGLGSEDKNIYHCTRTCNVTHHWPSFILWRFPT